MPITFPAGGLKPSVDADLVVGLAGEAIAYSSAVYRVLTTGLWKVSDSNALTAAARRAGAEHGGHRPAGDRGAA
jgi:hypothetical protein